jgi:subtilisin family serine protease
MGTHKKDIFTSSPRLWSVELCLGRQIIKWGGSMKSKLLVLFALIWGTMTACSKGQIHTNAPLSQLEANNRLIVTIHDDENQKLQLLNASQSYRVLSEQQNLFEVIGLKESEILSIAPSSEIQKNIYFESSFKTSSIKNNKADIYKKIIQNSQNYLATVPNAEIPPALKGCDMQSISKNPVQVSLRSNILAQTATMNLGETALFKGSASLIKIAEEGSEVRWDVLPPPGSAIVADLKLGENFDFTPDTVGLYQVALVVKSKENSCGAQVVQFLVTFNPEIEFAKDNEVKPTVDLKAFKHLQKIKIEKAWGMATGKGIKIAILDTGLNYNHLGIKFNLAFNEDERNGLSDSDDNNNGFKDDVLGWDFVNGDNKPFDDEGHGSHVSGLASSHIHGTAKGAHVLPVKVMNAAGGGDLASIVAGIYYAADSGANIINASLRLPSVNIPLLTNAIEYANSKNVVFVAAAGNDSLDLSLPGNEAYPAEIDSSNIVTVAATGFDDNLTSYSNFGEKEVDVAAPGGDEQEPIYSLTTINPKNIPFVGSGGTSMASPIVAGIAALVLEANPNLSPAQVREILMDSGKGIDGLLGKVGSGNLIDAEMAVTKAKNNQIMSSSL